MLIASALLILELTLWFYVSHSAERAFDRTVNLIGFTTCFMSLAIVYAFVMSSGQPVFVHLHAAIWFAFMNAVIAVILLVALSVRAVRAAR